MNAPARPARRRAAGWLAATVAVAGGATVIGLVLVHAGSDAPPQTTATELLADIRSSTVSGFTGTMITRVSLGLPRLPAGPADDESTAMISLLNGSHTLRVWNGGPDRQRLALLGPQSESDLFHSGDDLWEWDSQTRVATHTVLPPAEPDAADNRSAPLSLVSLTPDELGQRLLSLVDSSTKVSLGGRRTVAHRSAYDLVLTPRSAHTRVGTVHIAVDGSTKLPLAVQMYSRSSRTAAVDLSYSAISFTAPPSSYFAFTPPPGATVHTATEAPERDSIPGPAGQLLRRVNSTGTGWSTVVQYRISPAQLTSMAGPALSVLPKVHGSWGTGRLLDGSLFSVLLTDTGQVFAGAVDPDTLYAAASAAH